MAHITDLKDDKIRQLAATLKANGLAMSEGEAVRMAQSMSQTSTRVRDSYEQKKDTAGAGISFYGLDKSRNRDHSNNLWGKAFMEKHPDAAKKTQPARAFEPEPQPIQAYEEEVLRQDIISTPEPVRAEYTDVQFKEETVASAVGQEIAQEALAETQVEHTQELPVSDSKRGSGANLDLKFQLGSVFRFKG